jgi:hypothetical protein
MSGRIIPSRVCRQHTRCLCHLHRLLASFAISIVNEYIGHMSVINNNISVTSYHFVSISLHKTCLFTVYNGTTGLLIVTLPSRSQINPYIQVLTNTHHRMLRAPYSLLDGLTTFFGTDHSTKQQPIFHSTFRSSHAPRHVLIAHKLANYTAKPIQLSRLTTESPLPDCICSRKRR